MDRRPVRLTSWQMLEIVQDGRVAVAKMLDTQIDINAVDMHGRSLLHHAAQVGDIGVVELLLERGAGVNIGTPLHGGVLSQPEPEVRQAIVRLLLAHGANPNADCHGSTPLHNAVSVQDPDIVQILLDGGANANAADSSGETPLHCSASRCFTEIGALLLDQNGINIEATANNGATPLHYAARNPYASFVRLLLGRGANANAVMAGGWTPLHDASYWAQDTEVAQALLNNGDNNHANINSVTSNGMTPLHIAAKSGKPHFVQLFLEHGADIGATTEYGITALHLAATRGRMGVVKVLVEFMHGRDGDANIEAAQGHRAVDTIAAPTDIGMTALHEAASGGHLEVVEFLVAFLHDRDGEADTEAAHGRSVDIIAATTGNGMTALHQAATSGHLEVVKFLVALPTRSYPMVVVPWT